MGQMVTKFLQYTESDLMKQQKELERVADIGLDNGSIFNEVLLPEELVSLILSYVDIKSLGSCLLVCKKWKEIITSTHMWKLKCARSNKRSSKNLPWFAYYVLFCDDFFDKNLILNNCGENGFKHWEIKSNGGDQFKVEDPPEGCDLIPNVPETLNKSSCFATSFQNCSKYQIVSFKKKSLHQRVFDELSPTIRISEWYAGRFDCGCDYRLSIWLMGRKNELLVEKLTDKRIYQWEGKEWNQVLVNIDEYPKGLSEIHFYHKGNDTQFWAGHYGSKMTGAVCKILWDSILS